MPLRRCRHGQGRPNRIHYRSAVLLLGRKKAGRLFIVLCRPRHCHFARHHGASHLAVYQRLLIKLTTHRSKKYKAFFHDNMGPKRFLQGLNKVAINEQLLTDPGNSLVGRATAFTNSMMPTIFIPIKVLAS